MEYKAPLQYSLSTAGLSVNGFSSLPSDVREFATRLMQLADTMDALQALSPPPTEM